jgi:hypothetical protein
MGDLMAKKKWKKEEKFWQSFKDTINDGAQEQVERINQKQNRRRKLQIKLEKKRNLF